jgi:hypothetical protein
MMSLAAGKQALCKETNAHEPADLLCCWLSPQLNWRVMLGYRESGVHTCVSKSSSSSSSNAGMLVVDVPHCHHLLTCGEVAADMKRS